MATVELTNDLLAEIGGWAALKEARGLLERGRVSDARREGDVIRARVQGAEKTHEPQITLADRVANIDVRCTCAEFRKAGRVCPHVLAAGLAVLLGKGRSEKVEGRSGTAAQAATETDGGHGPPLQKTTKRWLVEDAPAGTPPIEIAVLLPMQLKEALAKDPVRIILEARREGEAQAQPFDAVMVAVKSGFVVSEDDERVLGALESATGGASGINAVPRGKMGAVLRALGEHPRIWLGKKSRVEVRASAERVRIVLSRRADGALEMKVGASEEGRIVRGPSTAPKQVRLAQDDSFLKVADATTAPPLGTAAATLPIPNWSFDGETLMETPALPHGFSAGGRVVAKAQIPDFLAREFPALERACEIAFAPGFEEFRLEIGRPEFEAKLEGALSGLTLELIARYEGEEFSLNGKTESSVYQRYVPDAREANRFWRRNILAERTALAEVEAAGFGLMRSGAATFSLILENHVARFLANTLPRWKRAWRVMFGPRLESTLEQVDIAQPEFSMRTGSGEDWLSLDLKLSVGGKPIELDQAEIQRWLQTGQSHARTASKRVLLVPTEAWGEMKEVLADCEVEQEPGKISVKRTYAPFVAGALAAQGFRESDVNSIRALTSTATADVKAALDVKLWEQLRPYQMQGVEWLASLAQKNFHGLLADDMGLGKTLQALIFAAWLKAMEVSRGGLKRGEEEKEEGRRKKVEGTEEGLIVRGPSTAPKQVRLAQDDGVLKVADATTAPPLETATATLPRRSAALVVCPTSLVTNWTREAARFVPHLRTLDLTGVDRAEKWAVRGNHDLLVTSYAILRRDIELYRAEDFSLVILDEAQHIKNRGSQNAQSAKALRARHRLILTGTPLENSVLDLWSLFDFLLPGYLGTAVEFKERYEGPLTKSPAGTPDTKLMERLRYKVRPFFLRRTKEEVLTELPPKLEFPTLIELSNEQREVYRAVLAQGRREVFEHSDKEGRKSGKDRLAVLTTLLRLRQVCCHLDLLPTEGTVSRGGLKRGEEGETAEATELRGQLRSQVKLGNEGKVAAAGPRGGSPPSGGDLREAQSGKNRASRETVASVDATVPAQGPAPATSASRWREPSAKMERTFELIDEAIDGGHRVLLFSQFVKALHLLRDEAVRREMRFCYLDGQTVERQAEVDKFQADAGIPLFFISLKAGGTGLNLTGADTVIHFDPWWNPAVEEQATSRAHRMGQARSVSAYKLIAAGTVEEKIQAMQARKRELFEASLGGDAAFVEKLSGDDLEELLSD